MRKLAYLVNAIFIGVLFYTLFANQQHHDWDRETILIGVLLFAVPTINSIALWNSQGAQPPNFIERITTLCRLHFERMKLEQEQRISELKKGLGTK
jgi:hypothetical protein